MTRGRPALPVSVSTIRHWRWRRLLWGSCSLHPRARGGRQPAAKSLNGESLLPHVVRQGQVAQSAAAWGTPFSRMPAASVLAHCGATPASVDAAARTADVLPADSAPSLGRLPRITPVHSSSRSCAVGVDHTRLTPPRVRFDDAYRAERRAVTAPLPRGIPDRQLRGHFSELDILKGLRTKIARYKVCITSRLKKVPEGVRLWLAKGLAGLSRT